MSLINREQILDTLVEDIDNATAQFGEEFQQGIKAGLAQALAEIRNIGEVPARSVLGWEQIYSGVYRCACGNEWKSYTNFCPKCGALMRMSAYWSNLKITGEASRDVYICSKCSHHEFSPTPYCSYCGSEMAEER